jgi:hypothetical protein
MVIGFTTTCAISDYHHLNHEYEFRSWRGVLDTTLCNEICQWLATLRCFSPVSSTTKTDRHYNIVESGNTITITLIINNDRSL